MGGIYDEPEFYAVACAYRDVRGDVAALLRWWERHRGDGHPAAPRSVLELAAGPAEHARLLASRGLPTTTVDSNPVMCAWARDRAAEAGIELTVTEADMRDFALDTKVDLAMTMLNSLCHLVTLDDMVAHLAAVARHVTPGGLYIAELAHPADWLTPHPRTSSDWVTEVDGGSATVRWGGPGDLIDPVTQVVREHVAVTYRKADGPARTVTDVVPNRFWTATELDAAIRLAGGFETVARYGDFDDDLALDAPGAWRLILVLRRMAAAPRGRMAAAPPGRRPAPLGRAAGDGD